MRVTCVGVAAIKSKIGDGEMASSFGDTRPAEVSVCCAWMSLVQTKAATRRNGEIGNCFMITQFDKSKMS